MDDAALMDDHALRRLEGKDDQPPHGQTRAGEEELVSLCLAAPNVQAHIDGKEVVKRIVVPGKLVNLVAR